MNRTKKKAKLYYLMVLLFFTAIMCSTTTYAWFSSNRVVTINTINIHVASAGGVEISADGIDWKEIITFDDIINAHKTTYKTSNNQIPYSLEPVSSGKDIDGATGYLKIYYGTTDNVGPGDYLLMSTRTIEEEGNGEDSNGKFIVFDIFLKVNNDSQLYLTKNSKVTYLNETEKGIANATRIAFLDEGTVPKDTDPAIIQRLKGANANTTYIWEPNYDVHTTSGIRNAYDVYGITTTATNGARIPYDGVISEIPRSSEVLLKDARQSKYPTYFRTVNVNYYTRRDFTENVPVFSIKGGITKIRVYMWIEGQDVDCENNASYDDIQFDLQLTINPT